MYKQCTNNLDLAINSVQLCTHSTNELYKIEHSTLVTLMNSTNKGKTLLRYDQEVQRVQVNGQTQAQYNSKYKQSNRKHGHIATSQNKCIEHTNYTTVPTIQ